MKDRVLVSWPILAGLLTLWMLAVGCASTSTPSLPPTPGEAISGDLGDAPDWVMSECSSYWDDDEARICAVGVVGGTANVALARTAAIARGRTELARSLQVSVEAMLKDYQATSTGGGEFGALAADEQQITDVSKQITDMSLSGTELAASWVSPGGNYYALVALNAAKFSQVVASMNTLSEETRVAIEKRAKAAFAELDREMEAADTASSKE